MRHLVVIGGGITGLSAAYYARRFSHEAGVPIKITMIEKEARFGGKVATLHHEGYIIEQGPDSFLARKKPMIDLTYELGMEHELVRMNPGANKTFILNAGKLHRIPPGLVLGIPTQLTPFLRSDLITLKGKLRALLDLLLPRRNQAEDESLGHFMERRLGTEMLERIIEPLLAGIYAGDLRTLSLLATFPQFKQMELRKRSLILGMMRGSERVSSLTHVPEHVQGSAFLSFRHGLSSFIDRILDQLMDVERIIGQEAMGLEQQGSRYKVLFTGANHVIADAVIMATPAATIARLIPQIKAIQSLEAMNYASVSNVVIGYDQKKLNPLPSGSGFLVPKSEGRFMTACTWTSSKWKHTAPEEKVLIRCYVGRADQEEWLTMSDQEIAERVRDEMRELFHLAAEPEFIRVNRLPQSMPQYELGHTEKIARLRAELSVQMPGIYVTGAAFEGVGLPDCVRQGKETAKQAVDHCQRLIQVQSEKM